MANFDSVNFACLKARGRLLDDLHTARAIWTPTRFLGAVIASVAALSALSWLADAGLSYLALLTK